MAPCAFVLTSESYDVSQAAVASFQWRSPTYSHEPRLEKPGFSIEQHRIVSVNTQPRSKSPHHHIKHHTTATMRFHSQPLYAQTLRYYAQSTRASKADRLGAAVTAGYCCLAFSAPFAAAGLVSKNAKKDDRYANLYVPRLTSPSKHSS